MSALWRRQALLVIGAGMLFALAWALLGITVERAEPARWQPDGTPTHAVDVAALERLTWATGAAGIAAAALLVLSIVHVTRVLSLTFRGDI